MAVKTGWTFPEGLSHCWSLFVECKHWTDCILFHCLIFVEIGMLWFFHISCNDAPIACPFNVVWNSVAHSPSSVIRDPRYGNVSTCSSCSFWMSMWHTMSSLANTLVLSTLMSRLYACDNNWSKQIFQGGGQCNNKYFVFGDGRISTHSWWGEDIHSRQYFQWWLSDFGLLREQSSQNWRFPAQDTPETTVQNLTPLALSSQEKSVTVQNYKQTIKQ